VRAFLFAFTLLSAGCLSANNHHDTYFSEVELVECFGDQGETSYIRALVIVEMLQNSNDSLKKELLKSQLEVEVAVMLDGADHLVSCVENNIKEYKEMGDLSGIAFLEKRLQETYWARSQAEKLLQYTK
jgi:hypothetical protein